MKYFQGGTHNLSLIKFRHVINNSFHSIFIIVEYKFHVCFMKTKNNKIIVYTFCEIYIYYNYLNRIINI